MYAKYVVLMGIYIYKGPRNRDSIAGRGILKNGT